MAIVHDEAGNVIFDDRMVDDPTPANPAQLSYYRQKIVEFQEVLNNLDTAAAIAEKWAYEYSDIDPDLSLEFAAKLDDYNAKKSTFRTTAEALNFAISGVNQIGAGFPRLNIPQGLGVIPIAAAAGVAGALAVAAGLIVWGRDWIAAVNERAKRAQLLDAVTEPGQKARIAADLLALDQAQAASESSPLGSIANVVKWISIAALGFFAWQAYQGARR